MVYRVKIYIYSHIYHTIIIIILNPISTTSPPTSPTSPPTSSPADGSISLPTSEPGQHHRAAHHQVCQTGGRVPPPASDDSDCGLEVSLDADPPAEIGIFVRREPQRLGHSQRWVAYSILFHIPLTRLPFLISGNPSDWFFTYSILLHSKSLQFQATCIFIYSNLL